ncbi:MAG TPA: NrfD/PsrC family molybdoenzyme membrane anchor subunit [Geminicoccaceae bacterium]|nr:NrfD/PsrC family molybdoenzyme membrane anchor subunit [Geminicoccaceae bacterium]
MPDPTALFGRSRDRAAPVAPRRYAGPTYYGQPALKPAPWDWMVAAYIFVGGIAGAAQIIATLADLGGGGRVRGMVRRGRYLALAGSIAGAPLLIADLKTPHRWYNMLRIFRRTSPMSSGSYVLTGFGLFSALTAGGQYLADRTGRPLPRRLARATQVPAAFAGAGMGTYTAALLSATSTPLWAAAPRLLAARFGSSAVATGAAALSLGERVAGDGDPETARTLDKVAMAATAADLAFSLASEREYRAEGVDGPLRDTAWGAVDKVGAIAIGTAVPLACYALSLRSRDRRRARGLSIAASLAVLAGGMMLRQAVLHAGMDSARRPDDYFRLARPENLPRAAGAARVTWGEREARITGR